MDPIAAKYIGAGIACIGMGGAGIGVGTLFGNYLAAALRNPSAAQGQGTCVGRMARKTQTPGDSVCANPADGGGAA